MRIALILSAFALCVSSGQACPAQAVIPSRASLARMGLERMWLSHARVDPARFRATHLSVDERHVYVQSSDGSLTAIDAESGKRRWVVQLDADHLAYPTVSNANFVLVATSANVYGIEKSSGRVAWVADMPQSASTTPAIDDDYFYVGTIDGSVYAFQFAVVEYYHRTGRLPGTFDPSTKTVDSAVGSTTSHHLWSWRYRTGRSVRERPQRTQTTLMLADTMGQLYGLSAGESDSQGKLRFQFLAGKSLAGPMASAGETVFLATSDDELMSVEAVKGDLRWRHAIGRNVLNGPLLIKDRLYYVTIAEGLVAASAETGLPLARAGDGFWWVPGATGLVAETPSMVLTLDNLGNLKAVDRETSRTIGVVDVRAFSLRFRNDLNDRVYLATPEGMVLCLRESGAEEPTFYRDAERRPITPVTADQQDTEPAEPADDNRSPGSGQ